MRINTGEVIAIVILLILFFAFGLPIAQSACVDLPGAHDQEMVKDCGDSIYVRGHYTADQLKTLKDYQRARSKNIKELVQEEIDRDHELEIEKAKIEVQTRLAEAQAPKIYVGGSYASGGRTEISNRIDSSIQTLLNNSLYQTQSSRSNSSSSNTNSNSNTVNP